jgi:twitching motility protein PilI
MTAHVDSNLLAASTETTRGSPTGGEGTRLGLELGEERWLLDLADVNEVIPVPELTEVPFTRHWFGGVANIRGNPVAVVDLNAFFGGARTELTEHTRLVVVAESHRINSALLVSRVLGLQPFARFQREPQTEAKAPWVDGCYRDADAQHWRALSLHALLTHPEFLRIDLPA